MAETAYTKPLPEPGRDTKPFWDALNEGRLVIQQCAACGKLRHYHALSGVGAAAAARIQAPQRGDIVPRVTGLLITAWRVRGARA